MFKINGKFSFQKILLILTISVFIIGLFTGGIILDFSNYGNENSSCDNLVFNLKNIQDITGELYISPDNSWLPFYENISYVKNVIKVETYEFTKKQLKSKFIELLKKGVDIKLIMENHKYKQFKNTRKDVKSYFSGYDNFEIRSDDKMGTEYIHSKINLVDSGFWIQTANLTHSSFAKNREYFFYSQNKDIRDSLNSIFDKDWQGKKILPIDIHPNLLVCNINCRNIIESILNNANKSIIIQTQYILDDSIWNILKTKSGNDDIKLRFVVSNTKNNDDLLKYFGPGIARKFTQYYNHTKMILVDDKYLILGSMNLSDNSLDKNREIGIILIDDKIISQFKDLFEKDWRKSKHIIES